jgi:hypothetical protein
VARLQEEAKRELDTMKHEHARLEREINSGEQAAAALLVDRSEYLDELRRTRIPCASGGTMHMPCWRRIGERANHTSYAGTFSLSSAASFLPPPVVLAVGPVLLIRGPFDPNSPDAPCHTNTDSTNYDGASQNNAVGACGPIDCFSGIKASVHPPKEATQKRLSVKEHTQAMEERASGAERPDGRATKEALKQDLGRVIRITAEPVPPKSRRVQRLVERQKVLLLRVRSGSK